MLHLADVLTPVVRDSYLPIEAGIPLAIAAWIVCGVCFWVHAKKKGANDGK